MTSITDHTTEVALAHSVWTLNIIYRPELLPTHIITPQMQKLLRTSDTNNRNGNQGPDTQKHLSPTYLSAVRVTAVKTTYFIESVYSKLRLT